MEEKIDSFFKVIHYGPKYYRKSKLRYPKFELQRKEEMYFKTLTEVEDYMESRK